MEFISSMTGKSPSTTGAGSEGALTKGPFNAMPAIVDLNASLLSYALTGYDGWLSAAGYVGPQVRVNHDISMLIPELFSRMTPEERAAGRSSPRAPSRNCPTSSTTARWSRPAGSATGSPRRSPPSTSAGSSCTRTRS